MIEVDVVLSDLDEHLVPERVAALHGVARFDLTRDDVVTGRHAFEFADGTMTLHRDQPAHAPVDVVLTTDEPCFVAVVRGERKTGLEYLAGTLDIDGDAGLAVEVSGIFRVPGSEGLAVDPHLLDPAEVATVVGRVKGDHLRKVMASDFRPIVLGEIFRRLPEYLNSRKARGVSLSVGFRLLGNPSGEVDRYVVRVHDGVALVEAGEVGEEPDATITCQGHDYLRLATGHLSPLMGVLKGSLKVKGDKAKALQLSSIIDFPTGR